LLITMNEIDIEDIWTNAHLDDALVLIISNNLKCWKKRSIEYLDDEHSKFLKIDFTMLKEVEVLFTELTEIVDYLKLFLDSQHYNTDFIQVIMRNKDNDFITSFIIKYSQR